MFLSDTVLIIFVTFIRFFQQHLIYAIGMSTQMIICNKILPLHIASVKACYCNNDMMLIPSNKK